MKTKQGNGKLKRGFGEAKRGEKCLLFRKKNVSLQVVRIKEKMKVTKIAKALDILSYLSLVAVFAWYFFANPLPQYVTVALLGVCVLKLIGAMLRANFFEKKYNKLKEENDFLTSSLKGRNDNQ